MVLPHSTSTQIVTNKPNRVQCFECSSMSGVGTEHNTQEQEIEVFVRNSPTFDTFFGTQTKEKLRLFEPTSIDIQTNRHCSTL